MTNSYCGSVDVKYANKHKELIERALYGNTAWHKLRERIYESSNKDLELIEREMPFSIKKASRILHQQFIKFMDIQDLDERTDKNGGYTIFSEAFSKFAPNVSRAKLDSSSEGASYDDE